MLQLDAPEKILSCRTYLMLLSSDKFLLQLPFLRDLELLAKIFSQFHLLDLHKAPHCLLDRQAVEFVIESAFILQLVFHQAQLVLCLLNKIEAYNIVKAAKNMAIPFHVLFKKELKSLKPKMTCISPRSKVSPSPLLSLSFSSPLSRFLLKNLPLSNCRG